MMMDNISISILLVEDNPGDVDLLQEVLTETDTVTFDLTNVEELAHALAYLGVAQWDLILLDLSLPDSQGLETLVKVHSQVPEVPIVILTGFQDEAFGLQAMRLGAQDYLVKSQVDEHLLIRAIRYAIKRKRADEKLKNALWQVKQRKRLLPICVYCKKIQDEQYRWHEVESYLQQQTGIKMDDRICPECQARQ